MADKVQKVCPEPTEAVLRRAYQTCDDFIDEHGDGDASNLDDGQWNEMMAAVWRAWHSDLQADLQNVQSQSSSPDATKVCRHRKEPAKHCDFPNVQCAYPACLVSAVHIPAPTPAAPPVTEQRCRCGNKIVNGAVVCALGRGCYAFTPAEPMGDPGNAPALVWTDDEPLMAAIEFLSGRGLNELSRTEAESAALFIAALVRERDALRATLTHLEQAYTNRHSPQHRRAALMEAAALLNGDSHG